MWIDHRWQSGFSPKGKLVDAWLTNISGRPTGVLHQKDDEGGQRWKEGGRMRSLSSRVTILTIKVWLMLTWNDEDPFWSILHLVTMVVNRKFLKLTFVLGVKQRTLNPHFSSLQFCTLHRSVCIIALLLCLVPIKPFQSEHTSFKQLRSPAAGFDFDPRSRSLLKRERLKQQQLKACEQWDETGSRHVYLHNFFPSNAFKNLFQHHLTHSHKCCAFGGKRQRICSSKAKAKERNKFAKLGDAIAISKSETITHPLTDRGRCQEMLSHLKNTLRTIT